MSSSDLHQRLLHQLARMKAINARTADTSVDKPVETSAGDRDHAQPHIPDLSDGKSRVEHRQQVHKKGLISYVGGDLKVECEIRDLTSSGAKLRLTDDITIPSCFDLTVLPEETARKAQVCWRDNEELGIRFIEES